MNSNIKTLEIHIRGMDCSECVAHVDRAIRAVPDVSDVQVFLGAEKARVAYQSNAPDPDLIRQAVKNAGYEAIYENEQQTAEPASETQKSLTRRLAIILGVVFGLVLFVAVVGEWLGLFEQLTDYIPWFAWLALILVGGFPIFRNVIRSAAKGQVISHTLMTMGVIAAIAVREWPTAAVVVLFMRVGDFVEGLTTGNARKAVKNLTNLVPQLARIERNGQEITLPINKVNIGDVVVMRPGESIPVDGIVIEGAAAVDQSAISGEGMPIDAAADIKVFAASIIKTGMLKIKTTATGEDTTFGKVIRLVEEAEGNRANVQRVADKFAGYYLPVVAVIALLTLLLRQDPLAAAATLVVACSCSFALATPVAMLASTGSAAKQGLLIKGGKYLEILAKVDTLFVDKTGTLTTGNPQITEIVSLGEFSEKELLKLAFAVEQYSEHPLGEAVRKKAKLQGISSIEIKDFVSTPGKGVSGQVGKIEVEILNNYDLNDVIKSKAENLSAQGKTTFFIIINGKLAGLMAAADSPRKDVKTALDSLRKMGINHIVLLSGDKVAPVKYLAEELGIDYRAGLLPEEKIAVIRAAQAEGKRVAMVGDGINDAPALAQADVGIAMGETGSDIAIEAAHIALLREDWMLVPKVFEIARRTMRVVKSNILFTAIYNFAGLSLAAFGFLPPVLAAALQSLPDVGILANSARLIRK